MNIAVSVITGSDIRYVKKVKKNQSLLLLLITTIASMPQDNQRNNVTDNQRDILQYFASDIH